MKWENLLSFVVTENAKFMYLACTWCGHVHGWCKLGKCAWLHCLRLVLYSLVIECPTSVLWIHGIDSLSCWSWIFDDTRGFEGRGVYFKVRLFWCWWGQHFPRLQIWNYNWKLMLKCSLCHWCALCGSSNKLNVRNLFKPTFSFSHWESFAIFIYV